MQISRPIVSRRESPPRARKAWCLLSIVMAGTACRSQDQILHQQRKTLASSRQTVLTVADAWVAGSVSTAYARTTLEETLRLLEAARADAVSSPELLADPTGADLMEQADRLSRFAGRVWKDVGDGKPDAVRQDLADVDRAGAAAR
jgi:hypothetical protein